MQIENLQHLASSFRLVKNHVLIWVVTSTDEDRRTYFCLGAFQQKS